MHRWLVLLNLIWGSSALWYDWEALVKLPVWTLPFILICPLFPFLLAAVWWRWPHSPTWLYWLAILPSAVYGLLATFFYPLVMWHSGFDWLAALQIPWVWAYSAQAWYLLQKLSAPFCSSRWPWLASLYLTLSLGVQAVTDSFGYIGLDVLPNGWVAALTGFGLTLTWLIPFLKCRSAIS